MSIPFGHKEQPYSDYLTFGMVAGGLSKGRMVITKAFLRRKVATVPMKSRESTERLAKGGKDAFTESAAAT